MRGTNSVREGTVFLHIIAIKVKNNANENS